MPSSDEPPEFYVDRSLGRRLVPRRSGRAASRFTPRSRSFGAVDEGVADEIWLRRAGDEGWVVLTKDTRIRYRVAEMEAMAEGAVRAFVLSGGNLSGSEQARRLVANVGRILCESRKRGPFVCAVHARRIERLWPTEGT